MTWASRKVEAEDTIGAASDGWAATSNALQAALNVVDLAITSLPGHLDALLDAYEVPAEVAVRVRCDTAHKKAQLKPGRARYERAVLLVPNRA